MSKNQRLLKLVVFLLTICILNLNITFNFKELFNSDFVQLNNKTYAETKEITFSENTQRNQSKEIIIPKLSSVISKTVNTGNVDYSIDGDKLTIYVSDGVASRTSTTSKPDTVVTVSSQTNSFTDTYAYDSGGYKGILDKYGSSYGTLESGELIPGDSKYIPDYYVDSDTDSFTDKIPYDINDYEGELSKVGTSEKYVKSGEEFYKPSKPVTRTVFIPYMSNDKFPDSYPYEDNEGYTGNVYKDTNNPEYEGTISSTAGRFQDYVGTVYGKPIDTRLYAYKQKYSGTVTKAAEDNRVFTSPYYQDYSGTVYGDTTYYYTYTVNIEYSTNRAPAIESISPTESQLLSDYDTAFIPSAKFTDADGNDLTCKYFIDNLEKDSKVISNTVTAQLVNFKSFNMSTLSEGEHTLKFEVNDGIAAAKTKSIKIIVDKTAPAIGTVSFTSDDNSITISGSATDSTGGLDTNCYRFSVGNLVSEWKSTLSHTFSSLEPNTEYTAVFEAKDKSGHIASKTQDIYTKSQIPNLSVENHKEDGFDIKFDDKNPSTTQYKIMVGTKYVNSSGNLTTSPTWITLNEKKVIVSGLAQNTDYNIKSKTKNYNNDESGYSTIINTRTLATAPNEMNVVLSQTKIITSWNAIPGATKYEIEADGIKNDLGTSNSFTHNDLIADTTHSYRLRVTNSSGTGGWSKLFTANTWPYPPTIPENIDFILERTAITVSWDSAIRATSYEVEADGQIFEVGNMTSFIHTGLTPDTMHSYKIRAVNIGGKSEWSSEISKKTLPNPPDTPGNIVRKPTIYKIELKWDAPPRAETYEIMIDGIMVNLGKDNFYIHENLYPATIYKYQVRARNPGGCSAWSDEFEVETLPEPPLIPTNLMATSEKNSIFVTWFDVKYAASYDVEIDGGTIVNVPKAEYQHEQLSSNQKHTYRVRAINVSGISDWSKSIEMSTLPEENSNTNSNISLSNLVAIVTNNAVIISWDSVEKDAEYEVEADGELSNNARNTLFKHTKLEPVTNHTYRIRVKTIKGLSDWCAVLSLSTLPNPPDAPESINTIVNRNEIEITWAPSNGAEEYDIEVDGEVIENGLSTSYRHTGLLPGTTHTYRVRAKNITGMTAWSEEIKKSTVSPTYVINCTEDQKFELSVIVKNVQDFNGNKYVITFDESKLEVEDLYGFSSEMDIETGKINGSNLYATYTPGRIEFIVNENIVPGSTWTGEISNIIFKPKVSGEVFIDLNVVQ